MAEHSTEDRVRASVAGLCAGDAMSWPSWWHRLTQLPPRREVRLGQAWRHARDGHTTSLPTPYLQSSAPSLVDPAGPTEDAEWLTVALRSQLGQHLDGTRANETDPPAVWLELAEMRAADETAVRGRVGTVIALDNLAAGLRPPSTGNDNPHYFDDMACVRAVAAGLLHPGRPEVAADAAAVDAAVTHALDGVWAARATAALIAQLVSGADRSVAVTAAVDQLPAGSWSTNVATECLAVTSPPSGVVETAARLEREVVDHVYAYANQGPETLGLLLAHLSAALDGPSLMLGALAHPRHADALVPLAGAAAGACFPELFGDVPLPQMTGVSIPALAGVSLTEVVEGKVLPGAEAART